MKTQSWIGQNSLKYKTTSISTRTKLIFLNVVIFIMNFLMSFCDRLNYKIYLMGYRVSRTSDWILKKKI